MKKIEILNNRIIHSKEYIALHSVIQKISNYINMNFAKPNISNMHRTPSLSMEKLINEEDLDNCELSKSDIISNKINSKKVSSYGDIRKLVDNDMNDTILFNRRINTDNILEKNSSSSECEIKNSDENIPAKSENNKKKEDIKLDIEVSLSNIIKVIDGIKIVVDEQIERENDHLHRMDQYMEMYFDNQRTDRVFWILILILSHLTAMYFKFLF